MSFEQVKVLVVDDNHHMRILLSEILRAVGVRRVLHAADGVEAMGVMRIDAVDVVMTDLAMRPMDGVDFMRLLRLSPDSPAPMVPVIMVSGHTTQRRIFEARDAGVNEFLSKPITVRGVIDRLNQIILHPRPFIRAEGYFGPDRRRRQDQDYRGPRRRASESRLSQVLD